MKRIEVVWLYVDPNAPAGFVSPVAARAGARVSGA